MFYQLPSANSTVKSVNSNNLQSTNKNKINIFKEGKKERREKAVRELRVEIFSSLFTQAHR